MPKPPTARKASILRGEYYPELRDIAEPGLRMLAVHIREGRFRDAYIAWRYVWQQIKQQHMATDKRLLLPVDSCHWYFSEDVANSLEKLDIYCIEDFDGWTQSDLMEYGSQIGVATVAEIVAVLERFDIRLPK